MSTIGIILTGLAASVIVVIGSIVLMEFLYERSVLKISAKLAVREQVIVKL